MKQHHWLRIFVLLAVAGLILWGLWPTPVGVEVTKVVVKPLVVTVNEEGKTRVIDRFIITSPLAGYLRRISWDVGDNITQHEELAQLEPLKASILDPRARAEAEARVKASESALKVAKENVDATKADLDYAQTEHDRKEKLKETNTISQEALDISQMVLRRLQANYRSAQFSVEISHYESDAAQTALSQYSTNEPDELVPILAPVSGQVLKVIRESEGVVNPADPILEIGDPSALEIEVDVLSMDAVRIKPGTKVNFKHWGGQEVLWGVVRVVEPVGFTKVSALGVEEQRVLVITDLTSPLTEWNRLGDGYRVEAEFIVWEQDNILQVPASSLFRVEDDWALFVINNNSLERRRVVIGHSNGLATQIINGVSDTDLVVTFPDQDLKDGQKVNIVAIS